MDLDPLAAKAAAEHNGSWMNTNPAAYAGKATRPVMYLQRRRRKRSRTSCESACRGVRDLPHMGKVRELESRRHEVEELIRHDLLPGELHPSTRISRAALLFDHLVCQHE